jgi:FkbM family methyltransferase
MPNFSPDASHAIRSALARLRRRAPLNAEAAQLGLLHAWESAEPEFPVPEAVLNAAYGFWEIGETALVERCIDHLAAEPGLELDLDFLRHLCGRPTLKPVPKLPLLLATNVGRLPSEAANRRQAVCVERLERTRDLDGAVRLVNLGYSDEFHGRPGWREAALERSARDLVAPDCPRVPIMSEVFERAWRVAKEEGYDHFAFLNSDIMLPPAGLFAIRQYLAAGFETLGLTRTDIPNAGQEGPEHWVGLHLSGIDLFLFRTDWWERHRHLFNDYIMGAYHWDCAYMGILLAHSRCCYSTQQRGLLLHVLHDTVVSLGGPMADHNRVLKDGPDALYLFLHGRLIEQVRGYLARHRSLPGIATNLGFLGDRLLEELRARLAPAVAPEPGCCASSADLLRRTGGASSPLQASARMEDPAAAAAEARLPDYPAAWFPDPGGDDPLLAWWVARRAQLSGQPFRALAGFRAALAAGLRHGRLPLHALEASRALGWHRVTAACASLLAGREGLPEAAGVALARLGAAGVPLPVHDPVIWSPRGVPKGDHELMTGLSGWRGSERIRTAFVVGAHLFEEKELFFRTFPFLEQVVLFEPIPACVASLRRMHGADPRIRIVAAALAGRTGAASFHVSSNDGLSSSLLEFGTHRENDPGTVFVEDIEVPCWTLDAALAEFGLPAPDLLFMDVQGAEYGILAAASAETRAQVRILFTEVSLEEVYRGGRTLPELTGLLEDQFHCAGYSPTVGHRGMHGNALFLNRTFLESAQAWGPSPLLKPRAFDGGTLLSEPAAAELEQELRAALFGELLGRAGSGRELYIWGAGSLGRDLAALLAGLGLPVRGVLDNAAGRWGGRVRGLAVLDPGPVIGMQPRPFVVIGTVHHAAVAAQLERAGWLAGLDFMVMTNIY